MNSKSKSFSILEIVSVQQFAALRAEHLMLVDDVAAVVATVCPLFLSLPVLSIHSFHDAMRFMVQRYEIYFRTAMER